MKRLSAAFALTALAAATIALAQQSPPQAPAEPPASTAPQEHSPTTAPSDPSASPSSQNSRQALMKDCMTQVQAANPSVPAKDIKEYCEKEVNSYSQPQN